MPPKDSFIPDPDDSFAPDKDDQPPGLFGETLSQWKAGLAGLGRLATDVFSRPSTIPSHVRTLAHGLVDPFSKFVEEEVPLTESVGRFSTRMLGGDPDRARELAQQGAGGGAMGAMFALPMAGAGVGMGVRALPSLGRAGRRAGRALQGEGGFAGEVAPTASPFYSQLQSIVESRIPARTTVEQVRATLTNPTAGIKPDELAWSGVEDWLATKPAGSRVTREEVLGAVRETRLEDVVLGEPVTPPAGTWTAEQERQYIARGQTTQTKFSSYVEPGAEPGSYREMFVTAPETYGSKAAGQQFSEIQNRLETARTRWSSGDRSDGLADMLIDLENEKARLSTVVNWSDGHEAYSDIANPIVRIRFNARTDADGKRVLFIEEMQPPLDTFLGSQFKLMPEWAQKRWADIGLKRAVRHAAENGFDRVAWTKGEVQVARYPGMENPEGLKRLYDESIPRKAKEISKRFGGDGRVGEVRFDTSQDYYKKYAERPSKAEDKGFAAHSIDITPDLRRVSLTKGFPLFSAPLAMTGAATAAGATLFGLRELQAGPPSQRKQKAGR